MKFWSTHTPQLTEMFKQIVLDKHIYLHDFGAIFENSWGGVDSSAETNVYESRVKHDYYGYQYTNYHESKIHLSLHLTLDTNARHEMPTRDWAAHRPLISVQELSHPVDPNRFDEIVKVSWPGSQSLVHFDLPYQKKNDCISRDAFDFVRQLFFDPAVTMDEIKHPRLAHLHIQQSECKTSFQKSEIKTIEKQNKALFAQKATYPNILHEINADNIDTYDLSKVNIYHLVPKDKQMTYFWYTLKLISVYNSIKGYGTKSIEDFFALSTHGDLEPMWQEHGIEAAFDFEAVKPTKLIVNGKDVLASKGDATTSTSSI
jgi:hypothetical protein